MWYLDGAVVVDTELDRVTKNVPNIFELVDYYEKLHLIPTR